MMIKSATIITYIACLCWTYNEIDIIIGRPSFASVIPCKETAIWRVFASYSSNYAYTIPTHDMSYHSLPSYYNTELRQCMQRLFCELYTRDLVLSRGRTFASRLRPDPVSHPLATVHLFSGVKQVGCEAEQLPISNVATGNTWSYTFNPAYIFKTWGLFSKSKSSRSILSSPKSQVFIPCGRSFLFQIPEGQFPMI